MKERYLNQENISKKEVALYTVLALTCFTAFSVLIVRPHVEDSAKLKEYCVFEEIIDNHGNPGKNFPYKELSPCDVFVPYGDVKKAKGYSQYDPFFPPF